MSGLPLPAIAATRQSHLFLFRLTLDCARCGLTLLSVPDVEPVRA